MNLTRDLVAGLEKLVEQYPGRSATELATRYSNLYGYSIERYDVNSALYGNGTRFWRKGDNPPVWYTGRSHNAPMPALAGMARDLLELLTRYPGSSAPRLADILCQRYGRNVDRGAVNSVFYANLAYFRKDKATPPGWYASPPAEPAGVVARPVVALPRPAPRASVLLPTSLVAWTDRLEAWTWQRGALTAWEKRQHKGVIEAVTGTGKTRVGIAAAGWAAGNRIKTLVIVPTTDLQRQWHKVMSESLPELNIGLLGDGSHDRLAACDILISTIQSCVNDSSATSAQNGLLIADECHRYGAEQWSRALQPCFRYRLGLTATYERSDTGIADNLDPFFGGPCYQIHYRQALADGIIAPFKIAFLGVSFTAGEQVRYDDQDLIVRRNRAKLIHDYCVVEEPFGNFMKEVNALKVVGDEAGWTARKFLAAFAARREVLAGAQGKLQRLADLTAAIAKANGTLVFTQTKAATDAAAGLLNDQGLATGTLHAEMFRDERASVLDEFGAGETLVIVAPKLLDEGIDVPGADLAIILAASRTRLQMVQRMGHVLRKKLDSRLARVVIMYVARTSEDPRQGAHEAFMDLVTPVAADIRHFGPHEPANAICAYLNDWQRAWSAASDKAQR